MFTFFKSCKCVFAFVLRFGWEIVLGLIDIYMIWWALSIKLSFFLTSFIEMSPFNWRTQKCFQVWNENWNLQAKQSAYLLLIDCLIKLHKVFETLNWTCKIVQFSETAKPLLLQRRDVRSVETAPWTWHINVFIYFFYLHPVNARWVSWALSKHQFLCLTLLLIQEIRKQPNCWHPLSFLCDQSIAWIRQQKLVSF